MRGEDDTDVEVGLPSPSVKALHLCIRNEGYGGPEQPTRWETKKKLAIEIQYFRIVVFVVRVGFMATSHGGVLVTWRYPRGADCLVGFRVEFAATNERRFVPLNEGQESIMSFYDHQREHNGEVGGDGGWYRVKAVDFWGDSGPYSPPEKYIIQNS